MTRSGLGRVSVRPRGGVATVELIPAPLWDGEVPAASAWAFREDRAHYSEKLEGENLLVPLVRHTLVMEFPATGDSRRAVDDLVAASAAGFVARVTLASGERIAVGYSARFGTGYPLRVAAVDSVSGRTPADFPAITLTLESIDAESSKTPNQL